MLKAQVQRVPFWNDLAPLTWQHHWDNNGVATLHDGCGVHLRLKDYHDVPSLSGGPFIGTYHFNRINFHWGVDNENGALHRIGDTPCAMEFHVTYYNASSYPPSAQPRGPPSNMMWAIVAFCIAEGEYNHAFETLSEGVKNIQQPGSSTRIPSNSLTWMRRPRMDIGYLTYVSEIPDAGHITWVVFEKPSTVSKEQIDIFRTITKDGVNPMIESKCRFPVMPSQDELVFVRDIMLPRGPPFAEYYTDFQNQSRLQESSVESYEFRY